MRRPEFSQEIFSQDLVLLRRQVLGAEEFGLAAGASAASEGVLFHGLNKVAVSIERPLDLSSYDQLTLMVRNCSAEHLLAGASIRHGSESRREGMQDLSFSGGRADLPPGGWVELDFPVEGFGVYGTPEGWSDIRAIELTFDREKSASGDAEIDVLIRGVDGLSRRRPAGPRLTSEGLARVLVLDDARKSTAAGPSDGAGPLSAWPATESDLLLRGIGPPYTVDRAGLYVPPPHSYPEGSPEDILNGKIMGQLLPHPIQWDANALGVLEWGHFLHRHHFMRTLVRAFSETGEARLVHAADDIISGWIHDNPAPVGSNGGAGPSWETLSVAWRLREWLWVMGVLWPNASFRDATKVKMLCSIWEHCRSLEDHTGHPTNWLIVESAALALAGVCLPVFHEARRWREAGLARLEREFSRQFFSDGAHFEMSPFYHAICLHALLEVREAARAHRIAFPRGIEDGLERCADYLAALHRPDFSWPSMNDSAGAYGDHRSLMRMAGEAFDRGDFGWIGARGLSGTPRSKTFEAFPDAGVAVMRSSSAADANMLVFRAGPAGAGHVHGDVLSLDLTAHGVPRLVDPGVTSYAPDPLTDYYRSASAHNTVLADARGPERSRLPFARRTAPAGELFFASEGDEFDVAAGACWGPWDHIAGEVGLLRSVFFVKPDYWIVRDIATGVGEHSVTFCWQFSPSRVEIDIRTYAAVCNDARGTNFGVIPLTAGLPLEIEHYTGALAPPRGWVSVGGADYPASNFRYTVRGVLPLTVVWVLAPRRGGAFSVKANRKDLPPGQIEVEVSLTRTRRDKFALRNPKAEELRKGGAHLVGGVERL